MELNLTKSIDRITYPETHVVYVEKHGPFQKSAPQAWDELAKYRKEDSTVVVGQPLGLSLIDRGVKDANEASVYEAGVEVNREPPHLPEGLKYRKIGNLPYARFTLTGPYSNIAAAFQSGFKLLSEQHVELRRDFCIERYLNDEKTTPPEQLQTELLIPIA